MVDGESYTFSLKLIITPTKQCLSSGSIFLRRRTSIPPSVRRRPPLSALRGCSWACSEGLNPGAFSPKIRSGVADVGLAPSFYKTTFDRKQWSICFSFSYAQPCLTNNSKRMTWSIKSSIDDSSFTPSTSNENNGRTRLIRVIQDFLTKLGAKIQKVQKNLPRKLIFFLIGFYCATAFATVIGQTGDWDILSAALAVVVVEGIGALMYRASLPVASKGRSLISMFNYWKAGLTLGLFLDSFKY